MKIPYRYRAALRAFPSDYRSERGRELLATLAEGDDERGRPSGREAAVLAYRGLLMRARCATSADGLLVAAAAVLMLALIGGWTWAERVFLFHGGAAAWGTDGPGMWWTNALAVAAYIVVAAGPFRAADSPRRRRAAVLLALPFTLAVFTAPGGMIFYDGLPDAADVIEYLTWAPPAIFHNWQISVRFCLGAMLVTWLALRVLRRLGPLARKRALGAALAALAAACVAQTWMRPDLPAEYGRSAFADLGAAAFMTAAACVLALAAVRRAGTAQRR